MSDMLSQLHSTAQQDWLRIVIVSVRLYVPTDEEEDGSNGESEDGEDSHEVIDLLLHGRLLLCDSRHQSGDGTNQRVISRGDDDREPLALHRLRGGESHIGTFLQLRRRVIHRTGRHGQRFARQRALLDLELSGRDDTAVGRHLVPGLEVDEVPDDKLLRGPSRMTFAVGGSIRLKSDMASPARRSVMYANTQLMNTAAHSTIAT